MSLFRVTPAAGDSAFTHINFEDSLIVSAADAAGALLAAAAYRSGDSSFVGATATAITEVTMATALAMVGWRFEIAVTNITGTASVTGDATDDTIDEIGTALATALNLLTGIAAAAYNTTSQVLTIAETTDGVGDETVTFTIYPPVVNDSQGNQINQDVDMLLEFGGSLVHEGASGDALSFTFVADTVVVPQVLQVI